MVELFKTTTLRIKDIAAEGAFMIIPLFPDIALSLRIIPGVPRKFGWKFLVPGVATLIDGDPILPEDATGIPPLAGTETDPTGDDGVDADKFAVLPLPLEITPGDGMETGTFGMEKELPPGSAMFMSKSTKIPFA